MQSLFNGRVSDQVPQPAPPTSSPEVTYSEPNFLLDITPWSVAFGRNLLDALLFFRSEPPLEVSSPAGEFWPDVLVNRRLPTRPFFQSGLYHVFAVVVVWGMTNSVLFFHSQRITANNPFEHSTITYYGVSEYLPPITTPEAERAKVPKKGQPRYAKQEIVSIRPNTDSREQTIISPYSVKLPQDIKAPNIVAWTPTPRVPDTMAVHSSTSLVAPTPGVVAPAPNVNARSSVTLPSVNSSVIPPPPEVGDAKLRTPLDILARSVVPPAPAVDKANARMPNLPLPSAVEPPVSSSQIPVRMGDLNIGNVPVVPPAPKLPVAEQRARGSLVGGSGQDSRAATAMASVNTTAVPPPPSAVSGGAQGPGGSSAGQLVALGLNPSAVSGPINVPAGSRSGTFAAGPQGKPDAPGTPEIKGGGTVNGAGGNGASASGGVGGSGSNTNGIGAVPAGIRVAPGPNSPPVGSVVVAGPPLGAQSAPAKTSTIAALSRPSLADLAKGSRAMPPPSLTPSTPEERAVFHERKFYSMVLNMPNLSSHGGSWIVRFAELKDSPQAGDLTAPVAVRKFDPAYPSDLIRDHVEGTVVLYAVIRANGTVEAVRVLRSADERLDEYARTALAKCQFRPATKNGAAVDLEAVVQIPFVSRPAF